MTSQSPSNAMLLRRQIARLYGDVLGAARHDAIDTLFAHDYVSHTAQLRNCPPLTRGIDALRRRLGAAGAIRNKIARLIVDPPWVWVHVRYGVAQAIAGVDRYQFDSDARIVAHWSIRQPIPAHETGSLRFDDDPRHGPTLDFDPGWLKARIHSMLRELWMPGNASLVPEYYAPSYVQHNPEMPGGYQRIVEVVQNDIARYIQATGGPFPVEIVSLGAERDLVFAHINIFMAGINRNAGVRSSNVDIFRVNAAGKMIEHWDVLQMESERPSDDATYF